MSSFEEPQNDECFKTSQQDGRDCMKAIFDQCIEEDKARGGEVATRGIVNWFHCDMHAVQRFGDEDVTTEGWNTNAVRDSCLGP